MKSKKEMEADQSAARDVALATALDSSNKGFKLMAKLGYKPGETLGKSEDARVNPIEVSMKEDRGGIGLDTEKKRKIREELEHESKRVKAEETDYRERLRLEREEKRWEGQLIGAQKVLEKFETDSQDANLNLDDKRGPTDEQDTERINNYKIAASKPLRAINVLWRGLLRHRLENERERRMRYDLQQSLTRNPTYDDPDEDADDKLALGKDLLSVDLIDDLDEEDPELDAFNALPADQRLQQVVMFLREQFNYCFWCKYQYSDSTFEACPGVTEEDHD